MSALLPEQRPANALIIVAKRPAPGMTKTRLSPPLSPEQASSLYECFLRDTIDLVRQVPEVWPVIAYLPAEEKDYFTDLAPDFDLLLQTGRNLGERLDHALTHYLQAGFRNAVIMDSDSPTLPLDCLMSAFANLENGSDAVLGPCDDGGYYLIGVKRPHPRLLREVRMSTPQVTADTLAVATEEGLQVGLLPTWYDVDNHSSLKRLYAELVRPPAACARHTRQTLEQLALHEILIASSGPSISSNPDRKSPNAP